MRCLDRIKGWIGLSLLFLPLLAGADEHFITQYFKGFDALEAEFTQVITNKRQEERSSGDLYLQKRSMHQLNPKFFFDYQAPFPQQLISNGKQMWDYDVDLMQVVIRSTETLADNPLLVILLGEEELTDFFTIKVRKDRRHYELIPKERGEGITLDKVAVYFEGGVLKGFTAIESSGQQIELHLTNIKQNPIFDSKIFEFVLPKGVDLIDER